MPELFTQRIKPKNIKKWLSQLTPETDEEYARRYSLGNDIQDQESKVDISKTIMLINPTTGKERLSIFRRIYASLRTLNKLALSNREVEKRIPTMEDDHVIKRLEGETPNEPPTLNPVFQLKKRRRTRTWLRTEFQPEPESKSEPEPFLPHDAKTEKEMPDFENVRKIALEGYDPVKKKDTRGYRFFLTHQRMWFTGLSTFKRITLLIGVTVFLILLVWIIVFITSQSNQSIETEPNVTLVSSSPIPSLIILPNKQAFDIEVGTLLNGQWKPQGAEWLIGTEVPRWLALPWTEELESAVRAFEMDSPIQLRMTNTDILLYRFQSLQELSKEDMVSFHTNTAELLVVLSRPDTSTRIVIVAIP